MVNFIVGGNQRKPLTCRKSLTNCKTSRAGNTPSTLVVIDTDCFGQMKIHLP